MRAAPLLPAIFIPLAACSGADERATPAEDPSLSAMRAQIGSSREVAASRAAALPVVATAAPDGATAGGVMELASLSGTPELEPLDNVISVDLGATSGACTFDYEGATLLMAGAEPDPRARGRGAIKLGGMQRALDGAAGGGPASIAAGPVMGDGQVNVQIIRSTGAGEALGTQGMQWPARMVVRFNAGGERAYGPGTWTCGV